MSSCANNQILIPTTISELNIDNITLTLASCGTRIENIDEFNNASFNNSQKYVVLTSDDLPPKNEEKEKIYSKLSFPMEISRVKKIAQSYLTSDSKHLFVLDEKYIIFDGLQNKSEGGSKRRYKRKASKKKKGGSVPINSQATVLQSASYAPSLDNSFLSQSKLVGGKKKRTQKKRKSLKKKI
jgi:hypothetical protein